MLSFRPFSLSFWLALLLGLSLPAAAQTFIDGSYPSQFASHQEGPEYLILGFYDDFRPLRLSLVNEQGQVVELIAKAQRINHDLLVILPDDWQWSAGQYWLYWRVEQQGGWIHQGVRQFAVGDNMAQAPIPVAMQGDMALFAQLFGLARLAILLAGAGVFILALLCFKGRAAEHRLTGTKAQTAERWLLTISVLASLAAIIGYGVLAAGQWSWLVQAEFWQGYLVSPAVAGFTLALLPLLAVCWLAKGKLNGPLSPLLVGVCLIFWLTAQLWAWQWLPIASASHHSHDLKPIRFHQDPDSAAQPLSAVLQADGLQMDWRLNSHKAEASLMVLTLYNSQAQVLMPHELLIQLNHLDSSWQHQQAAQPSREDWLVRLDNWPGAGRYRLTLSSLWQGRPMEFTHEFELLPLL